MKRFLNSIWDESLGFGGHKDIAIDLLKATTAMLDEYGLNYFLISGTLLGYARHNDFIPWDDDLDLLVEKRVYDVLPQLRSKYEDRFNFRCADWWTYLKISSKEHGLTIPDNRGWKYDHAQDKLVEDRWPFVDLFVFEIEDNGNLRFFHKTWDFDRFFPAQHVPFLGMEVSIPADPHHFLEVNFGPDYMTNFVRDTFSHKLEQRVLDRPPDHEAQPGPA